MRLDALSCRHQVVDLASLFFAQYGFETVVCGRIPTHPVDLETGVWCDTRPPSWAIAYAERRMHRTDPVLAELRRSERAVTWKEVMAQRPLAAAQRAVFRLAREHGMRDGLSVPVFDGDGLGGYVGLAGRETTYGDATRTGITVAAVYLHNRLCALRAAERQSAGLTSREIEILRWIVAGKSDWQIGQILKISSKTVNFHVENVKRKFGVATRIQAVVAAVREGNIRV
jgi:LuxR family quorum sensing-dependent transcriptional regulator